MSASGVPPAVGPDPGSDEHFHGRLLSSDARIAYLLLNEARYRGLARVFGISRENSSLVTVIAAGMAAGAVHRHMVQALRAPGAPGTADTMIGVAVLREAAHLVAGEWPADSPMLGALVVTALAGAVVRPVLRGTFRGIRTSSHRARIDFDNRYGHLIRRSRFRR